MENRDRLKNKIILIKGAGEKASAVGHRLHQCGFRKIVMTDVPEPLAERRGVSFCEAITEGRKRVCRVEAVRTEPSMEKICRLWSDERIPVLADPGMCILGLLRPDVFVDGTMAKRNTGTCIGDAPLVIALGPGFTGGRDAHRIVETNPNSQHLGRVMTKGTTEENTRVPASISGLAEERLITAPGTGTLRSLKTIGDRVKKNDVMGYVGESPLRANIDGVIWGLLRDGLQVEAGRKIGDIDPRGKKELCFEISAHARAIAGGVLEAMIAFYNV